ncbi:hypothetical protein [Chroococcidiopsis sp. CCMEE 29]|uniref:hypothetical protein n=1 Tax=Chroococcidiopsis sp. CCMEE 29 TaxID=155894 RepID=UPI0020222FC3|nr:hypothetical protein [Chroococcidiopsis sp. CCMEE 29]
MTLTFRLRLLESEWEQTVGLIFKPEGDRSLVITCGADCLILPDETGISPVIIAILKAVVGRMAIPTKVPRELFQVAALPKL